MGRVTGKVALITGGARGQGRSHGPDDPRSRHIPWLAMGPGVRADNDLTLHADLVVNTEDTFATAMYALGLKVPAYADGKPITQIFVDAPKAAAEK